MTERYRPRESVRWIVAANAIDLFVAERESIHLPYPEAALWDLLTRRSKRADLNSMLQLITGDDVSETAAWVETTLNSWLADNLIQEAGRC